MFDIMLHVLDVVYDTVARFRSHR